MALLDELIGRITGMAPDARAQLEKEVMAATAGQNWFPNPGPQTDAYFSKADVLLYGGQGGGGKTDLGLGLAFTAHRRSLILRRKYANLGSLTERAIEIHGSRDGFNGSPPPSLRAGDRLIQFGGNQHLGDEQDWQGHPFDLKVFDEAVQFLELMVRFHLGWLRTTTPGQRTRALLCTNPPLDADGDWIIGMFRPWLDLTHHRPAKPGELRWYVTAPDGSDMEVDGPEPILIPGAERPSIPTSRTFIPAALRDNPYLMATPAYQARLDALPEPLRSAVRDGNFMAARADADRQVIPTAWVLAAQARWRADGWRAEPMSALALDPAGGGRDARTLAYRHGGWYGPLHSDTGPETADGSASAALIVKVRRDGAGVVVDVGGGYGGSVTLRLDDNQIENVGFNASAASTAKTRDGKLGFVNKRAEAWWKFREELDPDQEGGSAVALPDDPEMRADLCAPTFTMRANGIQIESKDDLRKRLGRSTGKGDAVVMCMSEGARAQVQAVAKRSSTARPTVANMGARHAAVHARRRA
ncbi:terminase [uncultured Variovorax sp.]|uniref:terminase n=1 Tax=uncultured Variovorax sp. TaxID=114708 RepID=UPI00262C888E|nr:terminase [uncultured Variovorax sp.]